jgi:hypothetical protein
VKKVSEDFRQQRKTKDRKMMKSFTFSLALLSPLCEDSIRMTKMIAFPHHWI